MQNANSGYKHLLELHNFYKLNVSYVTTYIITSDYYSVTDKFKLKKTTVADWELTKLIDIKRQEYANNRDEVSHCQRFHLRLAV